MGQEILCVIRNTLIILKLTLQVFRQRKLINLFIGGSQSVRVITCVVTSGAHKAERCWR